ncbi:hypothetical protein RRG08_021476 [Elysia crispata]|uniref:SOCS box domain-containing protein n=1 Tax=Elysia crispata TaxID=231223 RepID=A0AAE1EEW8_9GAST|nr:hypothetical protein RRG08_021476 [Elysia crispata]
MMCCYNRDGYLPLHIAALSKFHRFFHLFYEELKEYSPNACLIRSLLGVCQHGSYEAPETCQMSGIKRSIPFTETRRNFEVEPCDSQVSFSCCGAVIDQKLIFDAQSKSIDINSKTHFKENSCLRHSHKYKRETCLSLLWKKMIIRFDLAQNLKEVFYMCQALIRAGAKGSLPRRKFNERVYQTYFDLSPLHVTAGMGSLENTKLLLSSGVDPGASAGNDCKLAVQLALQNGHNRVSLALLNPKLFDSSDTWISHVDCLGNTLFHCAVAAPYRCNIKVLEKLYKLGCPLDRPNSENMRPLDLAICSSHLPTIHYMLETKPELVNVQLYQDSRAYPPLLRASASPSSSLALCKLLLSHGADINAQGYRKDHVTACYRAFKFACFETGFFLCENSSRPFSTIERRYLWMQLKTLKPSKLDRLEKRLKNVPKLFLICLDIIRRVFINTYFCFQQMDLLPLPHSLIKALRYEV